MDLFYRYGFFSLSVRVVPRDDPGSWLIREPTADIFDQSSLVQVETAGPNTVAKQPIQVRNPILKCSFFCLYDIKGGKFRLL